MPNFDESTTDGDPSIDPKLRLDRQQQAAQRFAAQQVGADLVAKLDALGAEFEPVAPVPQRKLTGHNPEDEEPQPQLHPTRVRTFSADERSQEMIMVQVTQTTPGQPGAQHTQTELLQPEDDHPQQQLSKEQLQLAPSMPPVQVQYAYGQGGAGGLCSCEMALPADDPNAARQVADMLAHTMAQMDRSRPIVLTVSMQDKSGEDPTLQNMNNFMDKLNLYIGSSAYSAQVSKFEELNRPMWNQVVAPEQQDPFLALERSKDPAYPDRVYLTMQLNPNSAELGVKYGGDANTNEPRYTGRP